MPVRKGGRCAALNYAEIILLTRSPLSLQLAAHNDIESLPCPSKTLQGKHTGILLARFARIDSQIRTNGLILANRFRVPELNPFFANRASGGLKIANRRFEAIRANRSNIMKIGVSLRIDLRESIRANRPDSRCESPGHLSTGILLGQFMFGACH